MNARRRMSYARFESGSLRRPRERSAASRRARSVPGRELPARRLHSPQSTRTSSRRTASPAACRSHALALWSVCRSSVDPHSSQNGCIRRAVRLSRSHREPYPRDLGLERLPGVARGAAVRALILWSTAVQAGHRVPSVSSPQLMHGAFMLATVTRRHGARLPAIQREGGREPPPLLIFHNEKRRRNTFIRRSVGRSIHSGHGDYSRPRTGASGTVSRHNHVTRARVCLYRVPFPIIGKAIPL